MIIQITIGITSVIALWFVSQRSPEIKLWGAIIGLLGEPFWFYSTWMTEQWGIFFVTFMFTLVYMDTARKAYKECRYQDVGYEPFQRRWRQR